MNKNRGSIVLGVLGSIAVVALVISFVAYRKTPSQVVGAQGQAGAQGQRGEQGLKGDKGDRGLQGIAGRDGSSGSSGGLVLGAVPTLDSVDNSFVSIGGAKYYYYSQAIAATSSTVCSIRNPFNATATLSDYGASVTSVGGLGAQRYDLATSSTAYGTSTPAFIKEFLSPNAAWTMAWSPATTTNTRLIGLEPTGTIGNSNVLIASGEYLNFKISTTSTSGTFATYLSGQCNGVLKKL